MKIEEIIKQKNFPNEYIKLEVNLLYTSSWIEIQNTRFFRTYGISTQQYNVLRILRGSHPKCVTLNQITERMIDKTSNATRLVDKLMLKDYVTKVQNKTNRRQVDICITQTGLQVLMDIDLNFSKILEKYSMITKEEAEILNELLDKLH